jgi:methylated-DNA-protein-cysteine methyltransferase-like protein
MTRFEDAVVEVIANLERGDVLTYGEVAAEAGHPGAARAVGSLLRTTGSEIPWWRVVGAGGYLRSPNPSIQAGLLAGDGVLVINDRVDLNQSR